jgi:hypothetical protein
MDEQRRRNLISELSRLPAQELDSLVAEARNRGNAEAAGAAFLGELLAAKRTPLAGLFAGEQED